MRRKNRYPYPLPERLVTVIEAVADPNQRAIAACDAKMIGDTDRTRAILASCVADADAFYAAAAAVQLAIRALPVANLRAPVRRKPYTPPNRVPSLLSNEGRPAQLQTDCSIHTVEAVSADDLVGQLASATLEFTGEGDVGFLDLVAMPGFNELVARLQANPPPRVVGSSELNLFRDFDVEIPVSAGDSGDDNLLTPARRRRRRRRGPRPVGTDLIAMGNGRE